MASDLSTRSLSIVEKVSALPVSIVNIRGADPALSVSSAHNSSLSEETATPDVLYPHLYQSERPSNRAIEYIKKACDDVDGAVDDFRDANLEGLWAKLGFIADNLYRANEFTQFNEAFGAVVLHCYRAAKFADISSVDKNALFVIKRILGELLRDPFIKLSRAAVLVDQLEEAGWNVNDPDIDNFSAELFRYFGLVSPDEGPTELETKTDAELR